MTIPATEPPDRNPGSGQLLIATAPVNWNNFDLPDWRPAVPFPEILDRMVQAGYRDTEYDRSFGTDPGQLLEAAHIRNMSYVGAYKWFDFLDERAFTASLEEFDTDIPLLTAIGCRHLIVSDRLRDHRVTLAGSIPEDRSASLAADENASMASRLRRVAERATATGISVHYHNHVGTYIETPWELAELLPRLDRDLVDLCFDTGHYAYGGGVAIDFLRKHVPDIGMIHLKDVDPDVLDSARIHTWSFLVALRNIVFCPLGAGAADIRGIVETLRTCRFPHPLVIEQDTCSGDPTTTARRNREFLLSLSDTRLD